MVLSNSSSRLCSNSWPLQRATSSSSRSASRMTRCGIAASSEWGDERSSSKPACVVITTHAGLLDDLSSPHSLLAAIPQRVILDADLLEDEVARWSGQEFEQRR